MALTGYPEVSSEAGVKKHYVRVLGTGASAPTKVYGDGITVTRTGAGVYKYTWAENPGTYIGMTYGLQAATPADIAGHTLVADTFDTTSFFIETLFSNASEAAHDLAASEWIVMEFAFKTTGA